MQTMNIYEVKMHLSRLIGQVAQGESFVITKAGRPIAKIVPIDAPAFEEQRRVGFLSGQIVVPDDFDRMGWAESEDLFYGGV